MAMQVPQSLLNAGGKLSPLAVQDALCQVFRKAVDDYCTNPVGKRGYFNKKYFETLQGYKPAKFQWLTNNIVREMPVLAPNAGTVGTAGTVMQVAAANPGTAIGGIANALAGAYSTAAQGFMSAMGAAPVTGLLAGPAAAGGSAVNLLTGAGGAWAWSGFANTANPGSAVISAAGWRLGYPDGMMNFNGSNRCIEIKGPGDDWRTGQKGTFSAVSKPKPIMVLNCKRCKANCTDGPNAPNKGCP